MTLGSYCSWPQAYRNCDYRKKIRVSGLDGNNRPDTDDERKYHFAGLQRPLGHWNQTVCNPRITRYAFRASNECLDLDNDTYPPELRLRDDIGHEASSFVYTQASLLFGGLPARPSPTRSPRGHKAVQST